MSVGEDARGYPRHDRNRRADKGWDVVFTAGNSTPHYSHSYLNHVARFFSDDGVLHHSLHILRLDASARIFTEAILHLRSRLEIIELVIALRRMHKEIGTLIPEGIQRSPDEPISTDRD